MTTNPGKHNLTIYQGATFERVLTWKDGDGNAIDLTGYSARMQIRESIDAATAFLSLTTDNGRIALGGAAGTITLSISATDTAALTQSEGVYDLELVSGSGTVTRLMQGSVLISKEVTR